MIFTKRRSASSSLSAKRAIHRCIEIEALECRRLLTAILVTTADDSTSHTGESLRDAITTANADAMAGTSDTITFDPSLNGQTITLQQGVLELVAGTQGAQITIDGGNQITVSGNSASAVFQIDPGSNDTLSGLTITGGSSTASGGGIVNNGTLVILNSMVSGNTTTMLGGGIYNNGALEIVGSMLSDNSAPQAEGGGIENAGAMLLGNCTLVGNSAADDGGGIDSGQTVATTTVYGSTFSDNNSDDAGSDGGAISNNASGSMTVSNSTFSGNFAVGNGGGIRNGGTLTISNSTLSGNTASAGSGGGINNAGTLTLLSTIVAGNTDSVGDEDVSGAVQSTSTHNLIGDGQGTTGITNGASGNQIGTSGSPINPRLAPLANYGAATQTMPLLGGSPAINAGGPLTSLTQGISATATTIPVGLAAAIASTFTGSLIQIDSEQILVTDVSGSNLIVTRGYDGTTAAAHNSGASVSLPTDQIGQARVGAPDIGAYEAQSPFGSQIVTTLSDGSIHTGISLRDALALAGGDAGNGVSDTISFAPGLSGQTIPLTHGPLEVDGSGNGVITINGGNQITVSGDNASGVFLVDFNVDAVFTGLTITDGDASVSGGGVDNNGTLTISNCTVSDNQAPEGDGGGVENDGTLTVSSSTFSANSAYYLGGGIHNNSSSGAILTVSNSTFTDGNDVIYGGYNSNSPRSFGGGIENDYGATATISDCTFSANGADAGGGVATGGTTTLSNSTFSSNYSNDEGGGIYSTGEISNDDEVLATGELTVSNCTISGNESGDTGGGLENYLGGGTLTLLNTIVAGNIASAEADGPDIAGRLTNTSTFNLVGDGTDLTGITNGNGGNLVGTSTNPIGPGLLPLDYNGGPTQTMALTANSLARHAGGRLTSLSSAASATATSVSVGLGAAIASTPGSYVIQIDSEQMLVTNVSGNTLTVTRGYDGTTPAAHSLGAKVYLATDQTGAPRVGAPDIGAYQYQTVNSTVNPLPATESSISFPVSWTGTPGTEDYPIAYYSIYVSNNDAPFTLWKHNTTATSGTFTGVNGDTYRFYSIATDTNGDVQATPPPQATTTITVPAPAIITSANAAYMIVGASSPFTIIATGYPTPTFSETGTLPSGLAFNTTTGVLSGAPAAGTVGSYSLTVGASNGVGTPASQPFTLTIAQAPTKTTLTKNTTGPVKYGQSITFTAAVAPTATNSITPTGTVSFNDGATVLGTATLSGGVATFTTTALSTGSHPALTAVYGGDGNFTASASAALMQTVNQSATTTKLTKSSTTVLKYGQSVTFTATLAAVSPGAGTPTGIVTFFDNGSSIGAGTLSGGIATFTTTTLPVGSNSITAVYGGDTNFTTSTSGAMTQTVNQSSTTTKLTKNTTGAITSGQSVTFTATLAAVSPGAGTPTGTVDFMDNGSSLGIITLSGGIAMLTTTTLPVGSNSITAVYSGDTDFTSSASSALSQTVSS